MSKSIKYQDYLITSLKDPVEAAGYLTAALEGGDIHVFLLALRNVVQAKNSIKQLANNTNKSRTSYYKTLSENGNPLFENVNEILAELGLHFSVEVNDANDNAA